MDSSHARLLTRLIRSGLAALLLLAIANDATRYMLAWSQMYLSVRDMNASLAPVVRDQPEERAPAAAVAARAAERFGVNVDSYGQEVEDTDVARTVHLSVSLSNRVEHTLFAAPVQASTWKWPVRVWWHEDAAPTLSYEWKSRVVLQSQGG